MDEGLTSVELPITPAARAGLMNMRYLDSLVTDSSAGWLGLRHRIMNSKVNQMRDRKNLTTLRAVRAGRLATQLVTTAGSAHATPAGLAANAEDRDKAGPDRLQSWTSNWMSSLGRGKKLFTVKDQR